jgi:phosphate transport system substrate-binding protein
VHRKLLYLVSVGLTAIAMGATASAAAAAVTLNGSGSTLIQPLMNEWAFAYNAATAGQVTVNYQGVGSGKGIANITTDPKDFDFGASDAPLNVNQRAACPTCAQIPWGLTAVAIGYNIHNLKNIGLHLSGKVLAEIYLGQITKWNDPHIKALQTAATRKKLPNEKIAVFYRSDSSGDSFAFTDYLAQVSNTFRTRIGNVLQPQFTVGTGALKNAGVTAAVASTEGGIGYISASYLLQNGMPAAAVTNGWGIATYPNTFNIEAAALLLKHVPATNEMHIVNPSKAKKPICHLLGAPVESCSKLAYPISTFTYAIVRSDSAQKAQVKAFVRYALSNAVQSRFDLGLDFAPIPRIVISAANRTLNSF